MKVGDKYIIEIEEVIRRNGAPQIARIKGFNALVFDKCGLEKLEPYDENNWKKAYLAGYKVGKSADRPCIDTEKLKREVYLEGYTDGYGDGKSTVINESKKISYKDITDAYNKGLNDAWEAAKKIARMDTETSENVIGCFGFFRIMDNLTASEVIAKIKEYEDEQKQDAEIKVGDEVVIDDKGRKAIVSRVLDNGLYNIVFYNGDTNCVDRCFIAKTGRHFPQIAEVLAELRGKE